MSALTFQDLANYEREHLLAALRRDAIAEADKAASDAQWKDYHALNARADRKLLELLNPKSCTR